MVPPRFARFDHARSARSLVRLSRDVLKETPRVEMTPDQKVKLRVDESSPRKAVRFQPGFSTVTFPNAGISVQFHHRRDTHDVEAEFRVRAKKGADLTSMDPGATHGFYVKPDGTFFHSEMPVALLPKVAALAVLAHRALTAGLA